MKKQLMNCFNGLCLLMPKKKKEMEIKNYDNIVNAKLGLDM